MVLENLDESNNKIVLHGSMNYFAQKSWNFKFKTRKYFNFTKKIGNFRKFFHFNVILNKPTQ